MTNQHNALRGEAEKHLYKTDDTVSLKLMALDYPKLHEAIIESMASFAQSQLSEAHKEIERLKISHEELRRDNVRLSSADEINDVLRINDELQSDLEKAMKRVVELENKIPFKQVFMETLSLMGLRDKVITGSFMIGEAGLKDPTDWKEYAKSLERLFLHNKI